MNSVEMRCLALALVTIASGLPVAAQAPAPLAARAAHLQELLKQAPALPYERVTITIQPPVGEKWALGRITSIVMSRDKSLAYLFMRDDADHPIIVVDRAGHVVRSWGKGLFQIPHTLAIDPDGNIWAADAGSSRRVLKFTPEGKKLQELSVDGDNRDCAYPAPPGSGRMDFCGVTDIIFIDGGRMVLTDGYGKMRILVYASNGTRIREWGSSGDGPGQFHIPHGLAYDGKILYVADRENRRIQRFDLEGRSLGEWSAIGIPGSLRLANGALWAMIWPLEPASKDTVLVKLDPATGKIVGKADSEHGGGQYHFLDVSQNGDEAIAGMTPTGFFWFRQAH